jgi:hypothetical protein
MARKVPVLGKLKGSKPVLASGAFDQQATPPPVEYQPLGQSRR